MSHRYSVSMVGAIGAVIVAISLTPPLAGQAQTGAAVSQPPPGPRRKRESSFATSRRACERKRPPNELAVPPKNWKPARTPWGDPDLSGVYTNSDESGIPFERPAEFDGRRPRGHHAGGAGDDSAGAPRPDARARGSILGRAEPPAVLVGNAECEEQPRVARGRPAGRQGSADDAGRAAARKRSRRGEAPRADTARRTPTRIAASTTSASREGCPVR